MGPKTMVALFVLFMFIGAGICIVAIEIRCLERAKAVAGLLFCFLLAMWALLYALIFFGLIDRPLSIMFLPLIMGIGTATLLSFITFMERKFP